MEIKSVKLQQNGYLLNGEMNVPKADGNREYEAIKEWLKDNTPEPEFTQEELLAQENNNAISDAQQYLNYTDWIVVKINEAQVLGGDIQPLLEKYTVELTKRLEARDIINSLEG